MGRSDVSDRHGHKMLQAGGTRKFHIATLRDASVKTARSCVLLQEDIELFLFLGQGRGFARLCPIAPVRLNSKQPEDRMSIKHLLATASPDEVAAALAQDGAVVVDQLITADEMDKVAEELRPWIDATRFGPDDFSGRHTK